MAPPDTTALAPRRRAPLSFGALAVLMGLLGVAVTAVAALLYVRYVRYEPLATRHVPGDAVLALRLDVSQAALYEPVRKHLLPLLGSPSGSREDGDALLSNLESASDVHRGDLREIVVSRGPAPADWALVLGGIFPTGEEAERAVPVALNERTPAFQPSSGAPHTATHKETGVAVGVAAAGTVVVASTASRLSAARTPSSWASVVGLSGNGAGGAVLLPPALSDLVAEFPALGPLSQLTRVAARSTLTERVEITLELESGEPGRSAPAAEAFLSWLRESAQVEPGSTFLPTTLRRARTEGSGDRVTRVYLVWEREEVGPALGALADAIRSRFRAVAALPVLTGPGP